MSSISRTPSLTPSRSPSPTQATPPVQPDHFYGSDGPQSPASFSSDGARYLYPEDDPLALRGIPVFKPTMDEFRDFEEYMNKVEVWGNLSGIVKVIPPKEWTESLPPVNDQLQNVKIKTPIEQNMYGGSGLFRAENVEKRKTMNVREWYELCQKPEYRAPAVTEVGLYARGGRVQRFSTKRTKEMPSRAKRSPASDARQENGSSVLVAVPDDGTTKDLITSKEAAIDDNTIAMKVEEIPATSNLPGSSSKRVPKREGAADRHARDAEFLEAFDPQKDWLPLDTTPEDYSPDFCRKLEKEYWRNSGMGKSPWYGADTQGSLFTGETTSWNVAHLNSALSRLLPHNEAVPGVNTPYLYWGMWRATFAWHVEDMDLHSINYIHFGAPKFWYAAPQGKSKALEQAMRGFFPAEPSTCSQFLRHKSFLASPKKLEDSSCRVNYCVQQAGEFMITFPRGYHAGFNLGFNCAESVNFALESWIELGRQAKVCRCVSDSVRIDVDQLLEERAAEAAGLLEVIEAFPSSPLLLPASPERERFRPEGALISIPIPSPNKRKITLTHKAAPPAKKTKITIPPSSNTHHSGPSNLRITLKLGPRPSVVEPFPCCLCVSMSTVDLLPVDSPPSGRREAVEAAGHPARWMAHEHCASAIPETWVDEIKNGTGSLVKVVFGVDAIVKDRWNLKCSLCTKQRPKSHGAPIQCTRGKCSKAFHVSCARDGADSGVIYSVLGEVEKDVEILQPDMPSPMAGSSFGGHHYYIPQPQILKTIRKVEFQLLCMQHNPAVAFAKKANKQDKIRNELIAMPSMSRIKIRVSSGVFEVSLIRVIEETGSIEVLWDRGVKREFKWGSVVFGSTDGPIFQGPTALESTAGAHFLPQPSYTHPQPVASTSTHSAANFSNYWSNFREHPAAVGTSSLPQAGASHFHRYPPSSGSNIQPYGAMPYQPPPVSQPQLNWQQPCAPQPHPGLAPALGLSNAVPSALMPPTPSQPPAGSQTPRAAIGNVNPLASLNADQIAELVSRNPELQAMIMEGLRAAPPYIPATAS